MGKLPGILALAASSVLSLSAHAEPKLFGKGSNNRTGPNPMLVRSADIDTDGRQDLVVSCYGYYRAGGGVEILYGSGAGAFPVRRYLNFQPWEVWATAAADINGDGRPDIVAACGVLLEKGRVLTALATGSRTFASFATTDVGSFGGYDYAWPTSVSAGDLNGDGKADVVVGMSDGTCSVLLGNGSGLSTGVRFEPTPNYLVNDVVLRDVNNDGKLDLLLTSTSDRVLVLLGRGDGSFGSAAAFNTGHSPTKMSVGDLNGDGIPDVCVACDGDVTQVSVLLGNGSGSFSSQTIDLEGYPGASDISVGDFNGDGFNDIVLSRVSNAGGFDLLTNDRTGGFTARRFESPIRPAALAAVDLDGDGDADLVLSAGGKFGLGNFVSTFKNLTPPRAAGFKQLSYSVKEGSSPASIVVRRKGNLAGILRVPFSISSLTPSRRIDFSPNDGEVFFDENQTEATIEVSVVDNSIRESTGRLKLTLDRPIGGGFVRPKSAILRIINDDPKTPESH